MRLKKILIIAALATTLVFASTRQEIESAVSDFAASAAYTYQHSSGPVTTTIMAAQHSATLVPGARPCSATMTIIKTSYANQNRWEEVWSIDLDQKGKRITSKMTPKGLEIKVPSGGVPIRSSSVINGKTKISGVSSVVLPSNGNYESKALELPVKVMAANMAAIRYCSQKG